MPSRRAFLSVGAAALVGLAGCAGEDNRSPTPTDAPTPTVTSTDGTADSETPVTDGARPTRTPREPTPVELSGEWPQVGGGPGHGGVTDRRGVPAAGTARWHLRRIRSGPPVVAGGRLYHFATVGADTAGTPTLTRSPPTSTGWEPPGGREALCCRDASTGRLLWTRVLDPAYPAPAVADERVLVTGDGFLAAFRAVDGRELWRRSLGERSVSSPTVVGDTVLLGTASGGRGDRDADVRAHRLADGSERWRASAPKWGPAVAATDDAVVSLSAEFEAGSVLTARSLADGTGRWSVELDVAGLSISPTVAGDTVYVAPDDAGVLAFDLATGERRWKYDAATVNRVGVAASESTAYLVDDGRLVAVATADGAERWRVEPPGERGYRRTPAVGAGAVYVGRGDALVAVSRDRQEERWQHRFPTTTVGGDMAAAGITAQPVVVGGAVFAYAYDGLYALSSEEG